MSDKLAIDIEQVFLVEDILGEPSRFFEDEPKGLETIIQEALIVLDTNVLLIPYGAGASSLSEIVKVYSHIKSNNLLFIPAQVAREFVKNRPSKLAELYQGISNKISGLTIPDRLSYPILESVKEFEELNEQITKIEELKSQLKASAKKVRNAIRTWGWNDPVSQAYRPIFTSDIVIDPKVDREKTIEEMRIRYSRAIPPGYKDASKPDSGIGDFLIWKTILKLGQENNSNVVFVSGDEKADWFHGAEKHGFLPRYELQTEFRSISGGHEFYIIQLSDLLELKKAEESSVNEIRTEEERIRETARVRACCPECDTEVVIEMPIAVGSSATITCDKCNSKFHLHSKKDGYYVHRYKSKMNRDGSTVLELIECPSCGYLEGYKLGIKPGATEWCYCPQCSVKFPIHRRGDGSVFANLLSDQ